MLLKSNRPLTKFSWLPKPITGLDFLGVFEKDPFGNSLFLKRLLISVAGISLYNRLTTINKLKIEGMDYLEDLPENDVLFLSNHQTYFAEAIAFYQIFSAAKWGLKSTIVPPIYLISPRTRTYYVAANETMKAGVLSRIFALAGAITVERSWRSDGKNVKRDVDTTAQTRIVEALDNGWVLSFPQGTTTPYAPIRKGTAHLIQSANPIVVPVEVSGFRRAFDKKGLRFKVINMTLSVKFKKPRRYDDPYLTLDDIINEIRTEIGQDES